MMRNGLVVSIVIAIGIVVGALVLGNSMERFRTNDRYISVKGFSEREVKSDFVIWSLKLRMAVNNLQEGSASMDVARTKVMQFLTRNGINANEITQQDLTVTDKQARDYGGNEQQSNLRYIIEEVVMVRSTNVDLVQKVSRMTNELLGAGVILSGDEYRGNNIRFLYTKLNEVKPTMLSEAIMNARQAAEQFTKDSKTKLGKLRKASQGYFTIVDREESLSQQSEGGYMNSSADVFKKIRVVISADYSID